MKFNKKDTTNAKQPNGFALLLSVVILSTMLLTVLVVSDIFQNELRIASDISKTMQAIYAADSGIERALWELNKNSKSEFSTATPIELANSAATNYSIVQAEVDNSRLYILSNGKSYQSQRSLEVNIFFSSYFGPIDFEKGITNLNDSNPQCIGSAACTEWEAQNISGAPTCQNKTYWETQGLEELMKQEAEDYADCSIATGDSFSHTAPQEIGESIQSYYLVIRAHYSSATNETFSVNGNLGTDLSDEPDSFITCYFSTQLQLNSSSSLEFSGTGDDPVPLDWFALYSKKPEGLPQCNASS